MQYENFDLLLERGGDPFVARVIASPAGEATEPFQLGISDEQVEIFLLRIGRPRRSTRRVNSPEMTAAKNFGSLVYSAVFRESIRDCFHRSLAETQGRGHGLRLRIRLRDVPELSDIPWELLHDRTRNKFLALSSSTPIVRYLDVSDPIRPLLVKPPLRVLALISSPPGFPRLDVEREWANLSEAVSDIIGKGLLSLRRLEDARLPSLHRELERDQYHIIHFIGHGAFNTQTETGELILEDTERRGLPVSAEQFGAIISDHDSLRVVVLNACEGARNGRTDPFSGTAQTLVLQGVPSVIAMQWEITDEAAISFGTEFYSAIASGLPIDRSVSFARRALYAQGSEIEWATPVLYLRAADARIFEVERTKNVEAVKVAQETYQAELTSREAGTGLEATGALETAHKPGVLTQVAQETSTAGQAAREAQEHRAGEAARRPEKKPKPELNWRNVVLRARGALNGALRKAARRAEERRNVWTITVLAGCVLIAVTGLAVWKHFSLLHEESMRDQKFVHDLAPQRSVRNLNLYRPTRDLTPYNKFVRDLTPDDKFIRNLTSHPQLTRDITAPVLLSR